MHVIVTRRKGACCFYAYFFAVRGFVLLSSLPLFLYFVRVDCALLSCPLFLSHVHGMRLGSVHTYVNKPYIMVPVKKRVIRSWWVVCRSSLQ